MMQHVLNIFSVIKKKGFVSLFIFVLSILTLCGCSSDQHQKDKLLFKRLPSLFTGLSFTNTITETDSVNLITNEYAFMGGGVAIGDFNNDGLQDIFFSGNQVSCQLYINEGKNHFKDVSKLAGITTRQWCTGVSVVDINNDGWQDIYVCVSGNAEATSRKNLLYINNHDLTFTEMATSYGLADTSYSVQAAFFDYDRDGDLDMYLLNNQIGSAHSNDITAKDISGNSVRNDKLYRNAGNISNSNHPFYMNVSVEAGIKEDGYGLGVVVTDINNDNWPDVYVANDYLSNDLLWLNNKNGSFTNIIKDALAYQSYSSMGVDAADINNDGLSDIATLDMMPENNERQKMMYSFLSYERYEMERHKGYEPEFMRNMLQVNLGNLKINDTILPRFCEVGQFAGISQTDWSWSILMADFDNDGWKDVHITNGMGRDLINADFVLYRANTLQGQFSSSVERNKALNSMLKSLGAVPLRNYFFKNNSGHSFENLSEASGITELSVSNGAAYADFDNDGDLDLVVNNINGEAFFYENTSESSRDKHFVSISLYGDSLNRDGLGAKIYLYDKGKMQCFEESPVRGYLSSVDKRLHFGVGSSTSIDSIAIVWPDDKMQMLYSLTPDTLLRIKHQDADKLWSPVKIEAGNFFADVTREINVQFQHKETYFNDFAFQRLLPQKFSQLGPCISVGDVNGDGLTDFFVGGAYNQSGKLFIQNRNQQFEGVNLVTTKKYEEDMGSSLFDADSDGDLDLMIASGSTEFEEGSPYYVPRLYLNDGHGNFSLDKKAISSSVNTSAFCITPSDYDGDGDIDVFIGGRVSLQFPFTPKSYLLQNNNGMFSDVSSSSGIDLSKLGMVTSAVWTDFDNDHQVDLVVAGEWMPIRFLKNEKGKFREVTNETGLINNEGLWRSLQAIDVDKDGDIDLIGGNLGMNNKYKVDPAHPLKLVSKDIDGNGSQDPLLFYYIPNKDEPRKLFPDVSLSQLIQQVPSVKKRFYYNKDYAQSSLLEMIKSDRSNDVIELTSSELRSCWFENKGNGKFEKHVLPAEAQFSPINAILCNDFNHDGLPDLLVAGNEYQTEPMTGMYDASYGLLLLGQKDKTFKAVNPGESGFCVKGDAKDLKIIGSGTTNNLILVGINNQAMHVFRNE